MKRVISHTIVIVILGVAVCLAWNYWPKAMSSSLTSVSDVNELTRRGLFGDSFGGLNALFTGLAFVAVAFTIYLQLYDAAERDKEKAREFFESRFFRLSDSLRAVIDSMARTDYQRADKADRNGKDVFAVYVKEILAQDSIAERNKGKSAHEVLLLQYEVMYRYAQDDLGPYFRMLYHIIRYIDRSNMPLKEEYTDIIRAELSASELQLLAVNCLTERGRKFKTLVEQYHLLKHMPESEAPLIKSQFQQHYLPSAFVG